MLDRPSLAQNTEQRPDEEAFFPGWVPPAFSGVSAITAAIALVIAIRSNRRSDRVERINQFEREYGSELRALFRKLESTLAQLDAFIYPSGVEISKQRDELAGTASEIEDRTGQIVRILGEIDDDDSVHWSDWKSQFERRCRTAEDQIEGAYGIATSQPLLFQRTVSRAKLEYESGVKVIRRRLRKAAGKKHIMK